MRAGIMNVREVLCIAAQGVLSPTRICYYEHNIYAMKAIFTGLICFVLFSAYPQSTLENTIRAGQVVLSGFSILRSAKKEPDKTNPLIASVCVKNKLQEKITFRLDGADQKGIEVTKELVVQNDGKECVFNIPKGIYTYEVVLSNKEIYKKGEYRFEEDVIITIKKEE
jgi:hypothetical protein